MKRNHTQEIADRILAYLVKNPGAKDTLEGIMTWWLLQQDIEQNVALVRTTVENLMSKGFLRSRRGNDSKTYYYVNPEEIAVISAFMGKK